MRVGLKAKFFLFSLSLIGLALLVAYFYARVELSKEAREQILADLVVRTHLVANRVEGSDMARQPQPRWDSLADELGLIAGCRVTFVAPDGHVLGDSMVAPGSLSELENHRNRPEVEQAFGGKVGRTTRESSTTGQKMLYVARAVNVPGTQRMVVRLAIPITSVDRTLATLGRSLVVSGIVALCISLGFAFIALQWAWRDVRVLTRVAAQMEEGDLSARVHLTSPGEVTELGHVLNRLARNLSGAMASLRGERDLMSGVLSSMEEGALFLDENRRVVFVNSALRTMLLLDGPQVGKSLVQVFRHAELSEMLDMMYEDEESEDEFEQDHPQESLQSRVQGEIQITGLKPRRLMVRAQRLEGDQKGTVVIFLDVTETRRLENLRREFVANVSHELRTPVTSIRSAAETLTIALDANPEMVPRFVDIIDRNAARLQTLVEDVLDLSRIESRQFRMTLRGVNLRGRFDHALRLIEERAQKREVQIEVELLDEDIEARADARGLDHVVTNLIDNAVKYAGVGATVIVRAFQQEQQVVIEIADNGAGIDSKHLPRLFERFYRVDAGRSRDLGGTGLGLAIVKHLVESMAGTIQVESEVGVGTTFRITLPAPMRDADA
ncbi:MAG: ATP-binding protein [Polyangiaceae bacterium]|nr:ATP-binding protein [Polyangiaceae bacterium]